MSIQEESKFKIENGIIEKDGTPIKCEKCECDDYSIVIVDKNDYIELEKDAVCNECGHLMGYWVTGHWFVG